jgi:membrane protease YdiL (CAAX protease family)
MGGALVIGLGYGWIVRRTRSIHWTAVSHALTDFTGMIASIYST